MGFAPAGYRYIQTFLSLSFFISHNNLWYIYIYICKYIYIDISIQKLVSNSNEVDYIKIVPTFQRYAYFDLRQRASYKRAAFHRGSILERNLLFLLFLILSKIYWDLFLSLIINCHELLFFFYNRSPLIIITRSSLLCKYK